MEKFNWRSPVKHYGRTALLYHLQGTTFALLFLLFISAMSSLNSREFFGYFLDYQEPIAEYVLAYGFGFGILFFILRGAQLNSSRLDERRKNLSKWLLFIAACEVIIHFSSILLRKGGHDWPTDLGWSRTIMYAVGAILMPAFQVMMSQVLNLPALDAWQEYEQHREKEKSGEAEKNQVAVLQEKVVGLTEALRIREEDASRWSTLLAEKDAEIAKYRENPELLIPEGYHITKKYAKRKNK